MDMPCQCPECDEWVDLTDMFKTSGKLSQHNLVCESCYRNLESDEEE